MEWKRVKTILIAVLLVTCLLLVINIARQVQAWRSLQEQAVRDACAVAAQRGLTLGPELVLSLPERMNVLTAERDAQAEQALADALLGAGAALDDPGGGVSLFSGEKGNMSIRRGGALEIELRSDGEAPDRDDWAALLRQAGLSLGGGEAAEEGGKLVFSQTAADGAEIVNCRLSCAAEASGLTISGRWLLEPAAESSLRSATRAELVLALASLVPAQGNFTEVRSLRQGYYLESGNTRRLTLTPVWIAETDQGRVLLDTVTKKLISGS